ncbi:maestro heat-like repeat-containing protein family member 9 [Hipposideros larvatus]
MATSLWDTYSGILSHQAMILSVNSSFVDPVLQFETQLKILKSSFKLVFTMPNLKEVKKAGNSADDEEDLKYCSILNIYKNTLLILVCKDLYKLQILKEMIAWMSEDSSFLQERVLVMISQVLSFASKKVKGCENVDAPCLGVLAAELSLLCFHTDPSTAQQASLGLYHLLSIAQCQNDSELQPNILQDKTNVAQRVGQALLPSLLTDFVWSLLMKLSAPSYTTALEAAAILKVTLEYYSYKVIMVTKIVNIIYMQLCENPSCLMKQAMLQVIALLTRTSPKKVIFQLMEYPSPANTPLILMWKAAGSEPSVTPYVLKTILLILKGKPKEIQNSLKDPTKFSLKANMMPMAASQALCVLLSLDSCKKAVAQFFPQLLMTIMFQLFYSSSVRLVTDHRFFYAQDALRTLLNCSGLHEVNMALKKKNCWDEFSQELFGHHGVYLIAKTLSNHNFPQFPETLHYLYKLSVEGLQRSEDNVITVIFLTELLNSFFRDPLPEEFLALFINWVNNSSPTVSKLSLQKIASMAPVINQIENVSSILLSILHAFHSKDKTVISQALLTLRGLLRKLDKLTYSSLCTKIASSYCPLMDHGLSVHVFQSNADIRCMAIQHFGQLLQDMSQYTWMLNPVALQGLVPLILFLEDPEIRVVEACKHTLETCVNKLHWPQSFLLNDQHHNFEQVVLNLCNDLVRGPSVFAFIKSYRKNIKGFLK